MRPMISTCAWPASHVSHTWTIFFTWLWLSWSNTRTWLVCEHMWTTCGFSVIFHKRTLFANIPDAPSSQGLIGLIYSGVDWNNVPWAGKNFNRCFGGLGSFDRRVPPDQRGGGVQFGNFFFPSFVLLRQWPPPRQKRAFLDIQGSRLGSLGSCLCCL